MTREEAKQFREDIIYALDDIFDAHGLNLIKKGVSYNPDGCTVKLEFTRKIKEGESRPDATQEYLSAGFAHVGTVCWFRAREDNLYYKAEILKANRTRYVFQWLNYPESGRFTANFRGFLVAQPPIDQIEKDELT